VVLQKDETEPPDATEGNGREVQQRGVRNLTTILQFIQGIKGTADRQFQVELSILMNTGLKKPKWRNPGFGTGRGALLVRGPLIASSRSDRGKL